MESKQVEAAKSQVGSCADIFFQSLWFFMFLSIVIKSDNRENRRNFRKILQNAYMAKWKPEKNQLGIIKI